MHALAPSQSASLSPMTSATGTFNGAALAAFLVAARSHAGLSQAEAARQAGIDRSVLSRVESGVIFSPRFAVLTKLAFVYGLSLDEIAAHVGLPRLNIALVPPADLTITDARLRGALLALGQATDAAWIERTIAIIAAATAI